MTASNKERYRRAFSAVRTSENFNVEVKTMKSENKAHRSRARYSIPRAASIAAATCALVACMGGVAYAADLGGIRETVTLWIHGEQTTAQMQQVGKNDYKVTYTDEEGEQQEMHSGGVAIEDDGTERDLTAREVVEEMAGGASVEPDDNGRVWLYWYDQTIDITDDFDADGTCTKTLVHGSQTAYITVTDAGDGSYSLKMKTGKGE